MTIDEAIKHAEEVAEEHTKYNRYGGFESCDECAEEHRQLAGWLKELKQLREQEPCEDCVSRATVLALINDVKNADGFKDYSQYEYLFDQVDKMPMATPTRKKGKWVNKSHKSGCGIKFAVSECTCCGKKTFFDCDQLVYNYCPNCGSFMMEED